MTATVAIRRRLQKRPGHRGEIRWAPSTICRATQAGMPTIGRGVLESVRYLAAACYGYSDSDRATIWHFAKTLQFVSLVQGIGLHYPATESVTENAT